MEFSALIIDDNADFRYLLNTMLCLHFPTMSIAEAENSVAAWQRIVSHHPNLIFSDVKLKDEDGLELIQHIRAINCEIIIAVVTGFDGPEYRDAAYEAGADCFIPKKTASLTDFVSLVRSLQSRHLPQWTLGPEYINPNPPSHPWE